MRRSDAEGIDFLVGFALGAAVGAGLVAFLGTEWSAPARKALRLRAGALRDGTGARLDHLAEEVRSRLDDFLEAARDRLPG